MTHANAPTAEIPTRFVPADLDAARFEAVEPLIRDLLGREVASAEAFETWMEDRSELDAACSESMANLYIATTCDTADESARSAYAAYIEGVAPKLKPLAFELDRKQAALTKELGVGGEGTRYHVVARDTITDVDLFREENVPLETELSKLDQKYDQVAGAMTVEFRGEEKTLPAMARELESTDRAHREEAWRAVSDRRLRDKDAIDAIYDEMISLRHRVATNAGFDSFVGYAFKSKHRFDYTPEDCAAFHDAVEKAVVPFVRRLDAERREKLGLAAAGEELRPWDLAVDVKGRPPLRPFDGGADLVSKTRAAFEALDPRLAQMLGRLGDGSGRAGSTIDAATPALDLDSRKGKAPGGYQYMRDRSRVPFIFMNAAGLHRDVETMVHEAGHAFHSMLCVDEPLLHYRHSPIEFAEVASMSMELLTMPHWGSFYSGDDLARSQRSQLEGSLGVLPWVATIDAFQHWVYQNPTHTRDERSRFWLSLDDRFGHALSWDGLDAARENQWQRQGHLFGVPFYYIEYGIAQLGSLRLWLRSLEEGPAAAIDSYINALRLGGSKPLPELFAAAGIEFDFGADAVTRLVNRVEQELAKLPG
ncbi:MAG: M3 family oligoendopeptidase [Planctomycetota bacterium]